MTIRLAVKIHKSIETMESNHHHRDHHQDECCNLYYRDPNNQMPNGATTTTTTTTTLTHRRPHANGSIPTTPPLANGHVVSPLGDIEHEEAKIHGDGTRCRSSSASSCSSSSSSKSSATKTRAPAPSSSWKSLLNPRHALALFNSYAFGWLKDSLIARFTRRFNTFTGKANYKPRSFIMTPELGIHHKD